jgi:hypothetical protein
VLLEALGSALAEPRLPTKQSPLPRLHVEFTSKRGALTLDSNLNATEIKLATYKLHKQS